MGGSCQVSSNSVVWGLSFSSLKGANRTNNLFSYKIKLAACSELSTFVTARVTRKAFAPRMISCESTKILPKNRKICRSASLQPFSVKIGRKFWIYENSTEMIPANRWSFYNVSSKIENFREVHVSDQFSAHNRPKFNLFDNWRLQSAAFFNANSIEVITNPKELNLADKIANFRENLDFFGQHADLELVVCPTQTHSNQRSVFPQVR